MLLQCLFRLLTVNENQTDILHPDAVSQFNRLDAQLSVTHQQPVGKKACAVGSMIKHARSQERVNQSEEDTPEPSISPQFDRL